MGSVIQSILEIKATCYKRCVGYTGVNVPGDELNICACEGLSVLLQFRTKFIAFLIRPTSGNYSVSQHTKGY